MRGPEAVGDILERVVEPRLESACVVCGGRFMVAPGGQGAECPACVEAAVRADRLAREAERVLELAPSWVVPWCLHAGMSERESSADDQRIAPAIAATLRQLPGLGVDALRAGSLPGRAFGLIGPTGTGKSFALAALLKAYALARWRARAATEGMRCKRQFCRWVRWPEVVAHMRLRAGRDDSALEVEAALSLWNSAEVLVLDDLGGERARDDYAQDWTSSLLDVVVDSRYNARRLTYWTSNLSAEGMVQRYGTRLWSRLTADSPAVVVPKGPDLRGRA